MTGLENIIGQIKTEADMRAEEIIRSAEAEAKKRTDAAESDGVQIARELEAEANRRAADLVSRMSAADELNFSRRVLMRKQEIIRETLESAKKELAEQENGKYFEFLGGLLEIYRQEMRQGEIVLSEADKKNITKDFKAALKKYGLEVSERTLDACGGFILIYGSVEVNCTFDALFDAYGEELSDMLNGFLFGGGGGE